MRIYPGNHKIALETIVGENNIPLAYINSDFTDYEITVKPSNGFTTNIKKEVIPYTRFKSRDVYLFDQYGNEVENLQSELQLEGTEYMYVPKNAVSFMPQRFNYTVVGKKHMSYESVKNYNIKVGCIDDADTLAFAKKLMKVFGDAPQRGICPRNIMVNSQDVAIESLTNSSIIDNDFVFVESHDGIHYKGTTTVIDYDYFLNRHTNVWVSLTETNLDDSAPVQIAVDEEAATYMIKKPVVFNVNNFKSKYRVEAKGEQAGVTYYNIFSNFYTPILLAEHQNKGYVVFSHNSFLNNITSNVNPFYEVLMNVYFNTYLETDPINEWIADKVPDFIVSDNKLIQKDKFTSYMELSKMFGLEPKDISLSNLIIDAENVKFAGMSSNYIVFTKDTVNYSTYADPAKPQGSVSIFTPRQDIVYFDNLVYNITDSLDEKILIRKNENEVTLTVRPFKNSLYRINVKNDVPIRIPLVTTIDYKEVRLDSAEFNICCNANILKCVLTKDYKPEDGTIVATVGINKTKKTTQLFDMRQRGGGLPEDMDPDYNLLDIGHVLGRPYRKGGTLVITLPKRLEQHEEIILKAIKQYMVAEELPIILFE